MKAVICAKEITIIMQKVKTSHYFTLLLLLPLLLLGTNAAYSGTPLSGQIIVDPLYPEWLKYKDGGTFFLASPGDPEDFLYRGSMNANGTRNGDQMAIINKMIATGVNGIYFQAIRSNGGDGDRTHNPFVGNSTNNAVNTAVLDQWETWFTAMDNAGIVMYFFFYDDSAIIWSQNPANASDVNGLNAKEKSLFETLVNRFEHHRNLVWVIAEEYAEVYSSVRVSALAQVIRTADDHDHVIGVHKNNGLIFSEFANDPNIDQFLIQHHVTSAETMHSGMITAWNNAAGKYSNNMSESTYYGVGQPYGVGIAARKKNWAAALGGAYVMLLGMDVINTPSSDLQDLARMSDFMESTTFYEMAPHDELTFAGTKYVLAFPGRSYIAYAPALTGNIGIKSMVSGIYQLTWFDVTNGTTVVQNEVTVTGGDTSWSKPASIGNELSVYIVRTSTIVNERPLALPENIVLSQDTAADIQLRYIDQDGPGPFSFTISQQPVNGTLSGSGFARTYTPNQGFVGVDSFQFTVSDSLLASTPTSISIEINPAGNNAPFASDRSYGTEMDVPLPAVALVFSDNDGPGPYMVTILTNPSNGSLSGTNNDRVYTPNTGFTGNDSFTWKVNDGISDSNIATITVTVAIVNAPPINNSQIKITNTTPSSYSWNTLAIGERVYSDRIYTFNDIPAELLNADYLVTANDDKVSNSPGVIVFDVPEAVNVIVAHAVSLNENPPEWLANNWNYHSTSQISTTDRTLYLYSRKFPTGTVTLDGNAVAPKSMYSVAVVAGAADIPIINNPPPAELPPVNDTTPPPPEPISGETGVPDSNTLADNAENAGNIGVFGILLLMIYGIRRYYET